MTRNDYWKEHGENEEYMINNKIHGWLTFFLVIVALTIVRMVLNTIFSFDMEDYLNNLFIAAADIATAIATIWLGIYTIIAFRRRMSNAVLVGRMFIITEFIFKLLGFVFISQTTEAYNPWVQVFTPIAWAAI